LPLEPSIQSPFEIARSISTMIPGYKLLTDVLQTKTDTD